MAVLCAVGVVHRIKAVGGPGTAALRAGSKLYVCGPDPCVQHIHVDTSACRERHQTEQPQLWLSAWLLQLLCHGLKHKKAISHRPLDKCCLQALAVLPSRQAAALLVMVNKGVQVVAEACYCQGHCCS